MGGSDGRLLCWWGLALQGVDVGCWDDLGRLERRDEVFGVVVEPVFEIGDDLCHDVGIAFHRGVWRDVECTLGSFRVCGEARVL